MSSALDGVTVLLAAGGTGGHIAPALAVAAELEARGARIAFVTTPGQRERLPSHWTVRTLEMRGFERRLTARQNLTTLRLLAAAAPRAWRVVSELRPAAVVGGGGFASGPVVALAAVRGVPSLALEADAHLGFTNRLLRPFVDRICLSFPVAGLRPPRFVVTGRPLTVAQASARREEGLAAFELQADLPTLLVFGGSQGAQRLNRACVEVFGTPGALDGEAVGVPLQLIHVCGAANLQEVEAALGRQGAGFERYHLLPYTPLLAQAMAASDLVVARAGGSVAELAALGRPAVLVPYPYATADHQRKNAEWMVAGGAAVMIADGDLDGPRLRHAVAGLLGDEQRLAAMAAASRRLGRPQATAAVADVVEELVRRRAGRKGGG